MRVNMIYSIADYLPQTKDGISHHDLIDVPFSSIGTMNFFIIGHIIMVNVQNKFERKDR